MVFNRHLKALNLCNHSDTIACVLYELLVNLELINVGFQTHDQGSTSFSFVQFSRSCSLPRLRDSLYIIHQKFLKVKRFSESFFEEVFFKKRRTSCYEALFAGCPRETAWLYYHTHSGMSTPFFGFFDKFWRGFLGGMYMGVAEGSGHNIGKRRGRTHRCAPTVG